MRHLKYILGFPQSQENLSHKLHQPFPDNFVLKQLHGDRKGQSCCVLHQSPPGLFHGKKELLVTPYTLTVHEKILFSSSLDFVGELGKAWYVQSSRQAVDERGHRCNLTTAFVKPLIQSSELCSTACFLQEVS